jgi:hypothetical protein
MFLREAVLKPWQPLGMGMFFPWKIRNGKDSEIRKWQWKGALQQWLVIHLYEWIVLLLIVIGQHVHRNEFSSALALIHIIFISVVVFLTWHFWFTLTQRNPIGLPMSCCGMIWGSCATCPLILLFLIFVKEPVLNALGLNDNDVFWKWELEDLIIYIVFGAPVIGGVSGVCCQERSTASASAFVKWIGFSMVVMYACYVVPVTLFFVFAVARGRPAGVWLRSHEPVGLAALVLLFYVVPATQLMVAECMYKVGREERRVVQKGVEKRGNSKESASTAATDEENPTAASTHEGVLVHGEDTEEGKEHPGPPSLTK